MAEAVNYALGQWTELNAFCSAAVPIDNNISEREMKRVVLNRRTLSSSATRVEGEPLPYWQV
jgi:Transposase IS66 family